MVLRGHGEEAMPDGDACAPAKLQHHEYGSERVHRLAEIRKVR